MKMKKQKNFHQSPAQDRFSPGEAYAGTIYKLKHPEKAAGYQYKPPKASSNY